MNRVLMFKPPFPSGAIVQAQEADSVVLPVVGLVLTITRAELWGAWIHKPEGEPPCVHHVYGPDSGKGCTAKEVEVLGILVGVDALTQGQISDIMKSGPSSLDIQEPPTIKTHRPV